MDELYRIFVSKMGFPPVVGQTVVRLLLAAILGGVVGLEGEIKHKSAGLRTKIFMQEHQSLLNRLRQSTLLRSVNFLGPAEGE